MTSALNASGENKAGPVLEVRDLAKSYGGKVVISDFNLTVGAGEVQGILGPNGSGKTTLISILSGLVTAEKGEAKICGRRSTDPRSRHDLGLAPDDLPMPNAITGREYLKFVSALRSTDDTERGLALARAFRLDESLDKAISEYSHGMQRKLQIIAAIMHRPRLLVLDEPFRGLDPEAAVTLRMVLNNWRRTGRTVLIATHDMLRAERDCDAVTILHEGTTVAQGAPADLVGTGTIEDLFLTRTGLSGRSQENYTILERSLED